MKIAALCDQDTGVGLRLAGITQIHTPNEQDILPVWNTLQEDHSLGVILVTERIATRLDKHLRDFRLQHPLPVIIEIPDKKGPIKDHIDFVSQLIKKAVGIEVTKSV
jgi:V/A-type H+-transporting ATPase subunit F